MVRRGCVMSAAMKKSALIAAWILAVGFGVGGCDDKPAAGEKKAEGDTPAAGDTAAANAPDLKATCADMCKKANECAPEIAKQAGEQAAAILQGDAAKKAAAKAAEAMETKYKEQFSDCDKVCSDAEKSMSKDKGGNATKLKACNEEKDCKKFWDCQVKVMADAAK